MMDNRHSSASERYDRAMAQRRYVKTLVITSALMLIGSFLVLGYAALRCTS
jgi:hypothetical protein